MDIHKLKDLSPDDRLSVLQGEALPGQEEQIYPRVLEDAEIAAYERSLAQHSIQIAALEKELSEIKAMYKDKLKPLRELFGVAIDCIRSGSVQEKGIVYRIPDYDNRMIHVVTSQGVVLHSRQMRPEERQYHMTPQLGKAI